MSASPRIDRLAFRSHGLCPVRCVIRGGSSSKYGRAQVCARSPMGLTRRIRRHCARIRRSRKGIVMDHYELPPALSIAYGDIDKEHGELIDTLTGTCACFSASRILPRIIFALFCRECGTISNGISCMRKRKWPGSTIPSGKSSWAASRPLRQTPREEICGAVFTGRKLIDRDLLDDLFDIIMDDVIRADADLKSFLSARNLCFDALV